MRQRTKQTRTSRGGRCLSRRIVRLVRPDSSATTAWISRRQRKTRLEAWLAPLGVDWQRRRNTGSAVTSADSTTDSRLTARDTLGNSRIPGDGTGYPFLLMGLSPTWVYMVQRRNCSTVSSVHGHTATYVQRCWQRVVQAADDSAIETLSKRSVPSYRPSMRFTKLGKFMPLIKQLVNHDHAHRYHLGHSESWNTTSNTGTNFVPSASATHHYTQEFANNVIGPDILTYLCG